LDLCGSNVQRKNDVPEYSLRNLLEQLFNWNDL
jgi:hypothetical protein